MLREQSIPPILEAYEEWATAFRRQWLRRNKPQGMESTQIRIGAGATRFRETALRLKEFCEGEIETIEELDASFDAPTLNPVRYFAWLSSGSVRI